MEYSPSMLSEKLMAVIAPENNANSNFKGGRTFSKGSATHVEIVCSHSICDTDHNALYSMFKYFFWVISPECPWP
jgi:hypothetical protein